VESRQQLIEQALAELHAVPGVAAASIVEFAPLSGMPGMAIGWRAPGREAQMQSVAFVNLVGADYFRAAGTIVLRGRGIEQSDRWNTARVAVVNETMARLLADDRDPVGECVQFDEQLQEGGCTRIVGVSRTQRIRYLDERAVPVVYRPWLQARTASPYAKPVFVVRTQGAPAGHTAAVRDALQRLRGDLPYVDVRTLEARIPPEVLPYRLGAWLFAGFGALALVLASIGLYGLLAYLVGEREPEIALRRSLGASGSRVSTLILRQALLPIGIGVAVGVIMALAGSRYLAALLFGVDARDPWSFGAALVCVALICVAAILPPVARALRIEPAAALRHR
jgi:hypothetical protein